MTLTPGILEHPNHGRNCAALGTVLPFMMSVVGLSLPGTIILRRVFEGPLDLHFHRSGLGGRHLHMLPVQLGHVT